MASAVIFPSNQRVVPGSVNVPIAKLPPPTPSKQDDPEEVAQRLVTTFNQALAASDGNSLANLFVNLGFWRDHLALTWEFRTACGTTNIRKLVDEAIQSKDGLRLRKISLDKSTEARRPQTSVLDAEGTVPCIQLFISLETVRGVGNGVARLVFEGGSWKIFTLYTTLRELKGHEEAVFNRRARGVDHGGQPGRRNWLEKRAEEKEYRDGNEPTVVILGMTIKSPTLAPLTMYRCWSGWVDDCSTSQGYRYQQPHRRPEQPCG